jgi:hypothetical protein
MGSGRSPCRRCTFSRDVVAEDFQACLSWLVGRDSSHTVSVCVALKSIDLEQAIGVAIALIQREKPQEAIIALQRALSHSDAMS